MTKYIAPAFALAVIALTGMGTSASAQYMTTPNLAYPDGTGSWGCKFSGTCATATVATSGQKK